MLPPKSWLFKYVLQNPLVCLPIYMCLLVVIIGHTFLGQSGIFHVGLALCRKNFTQVYQVYTSSPADACPHKSRPINENRRPNSTMAGIIPVRPCSPDPIVCPPHIPVTPARLCCLCIGNLPFTHLEGCAICYPI
jgi:hypothetical protein